MSGKPITARITDVKWRKIGKFFDEPVILQYYLGRTLYEEKFDSPLLNEANLKLWRRLILGAVTGSPAGEGDARSETTGEYKNALVGKDVYIGVEEGIVYAIGVDSKHMFFPDLYGFFNPEGLMSDDKQAKK